MSASVTPQRRRRSVEDDDEEDLYSSSPKRARLGDEDEVEDEEEGSHSSPDAPLLPDNFRRSPKGKGRASVGEKHLPGSIVRVTLTDFVTYTKAEFKPGPNLNMIIGPNGTGKSTLVCAICLGLGWGSKHLGRAKDVGEFVKHNMKRAIIEVELAADPDRHAANPVVTTKIIREGNKTEFAIDGKKTSKKEVEKLMRSFSIQVDNLCQFLPQDRVVEFSQLSPVDLLVQTQRAAAPEQMCEWHDELKATRKEQKAKQIEQQAMVDDLKGKENRQNQQQGMVERLRERSELQTRLTNLERLRPFPEFKVAKQKHTEAKNRMKEAEKEFKRLENQAAPNLQAEKDKDVYLKKVQAVVTKRLKMVERAETNADRQASELTTKEDKIKGCEKSIALEREAKNKAKSGMPDLNRQKTALERAIANPPEEVDFAAYNAEIREKTRLMREKEGRQQELYQSTASLRQQAAQRQQVVEQALEEKASLQTQAGQQANKLKAVSRHAAQAWEWIQRNRNRFQSEVFGPPLVECIVKDPRHAAAAENAIGNSELTALTVTSQADFEMLGNELYDRQKLSDINLRLSQRGVSAFKPPCPPDRLRSFGLEAYILDLIDGPDPVLAMLCDNRRIEGAAFTSHDLSDQQVQVLTRPDSPITQWMTPRESYQVNRRREYGDAAVSTRNRALQPARYFTDAPASQNEDAELDQRVQDAKRDVEEYQRQMQEFKAEHNELKREQDELQKEQKKLQDEKNRKQTALSGFNALPTKLEGVERKIEETRVLIAGTQDRINGIVEEGDKLTLEKGQLTIDSANAVNVLRGYIVDHVEAQILAIEAQSDLEQLRLRTREEKALLQERQQEVQRLTVEKAALLQRGQELSAMCGGMRDMIAADEVLHDLCEQVREWTPEELETEVQSVQARFDMTDGGANSKQVLRDYEERAIKIEKLRSKLAAAEERLAGLDARITEVRQQWEPELDILIAQISEAFAENFSKIQCAGEVAVHKDEDFEAWAIQIKVKFRENEPLSLLDSKRQSGGERAVSTIFYLLALQTLARAPFRVVDEINQGMDPRNERLVHSRMVDIACSGESASQYFLITPKLLNGLRYAKGMKVHCIASGEFMPEDYKGLDFGVLARRALGVRAGAV